MPDAPSKYMTYAASELAAALKKISGATFGVVEAGEAPRRNVLRLDLMVDTILDQYIRHHDFDPVPDHMFFKYKISLEGE